MTPSRDALFDLAVNRAAKAVALTATGAPGALRAALEVWYLRTRFAYRTPFERLLDAVRQRPPGNVHWQGGSGGRWRQGPPPRP